MKTRLTGALAILALLALLAAASCAPAMPSPAVEQPTAGPDAEETTPPQSTQAPTNPAQPTPTRPGEPAPTAPVELRVVELEWPARLRLGESDVLRLALVPSADGYTARADFEEHSLATEEVPIARPPGYTLRAVARLDGPGFDISPTGDQALLVPAGETVTWRWSLSPLSPGRQRLTINLLLRWEPESGADRVARPPGEAQAFTQAIEVQVTSLLGLTRAQAGLFGALALILGGSLGAVALFTRRPKALSAPALQARAPNPALILEPAAGMAVAGEESRLLQALFQRYARVVLESEFLSGYSGARTFLCRPVLPDGTADAATIVKIGPREPVREEYANYERFVRDRLPPVTARIQHAPVTLNGGALAALQYTCINEPGRAPRSLRLALLSNPDPALLYRLFDTFGPHWWLQRRPFAFRAGLEYDRLLPPHLALVPATAAANLPAAGPDLPVGALCRLPTFTRLAPRADGRSFTLWVESPSGQPPQRLRWLHPEAPRAGQSARVIQNRAGLLAELTQGFHLLGLPDPLARLDGWLQTTLQGTRSTIHGDLNLENALVGPGGLVWLIDFAETREGHTLYDFARLSAEIAAHILAPRAGSPPAFLDLLQQGDPLLAAVEDLARRCLFDPQQPREFRLALALSCLGALKFGNLTPLARECLYLLAARQVAHLEG